MSTEMPPTQASPTSLIGQVVAGNFRVLEKIGEGGMGVVYLAEQLSLGRKVALKVLHQRYTRDEEFSKRFRREARLAASLNHINIVTMYDFGQEGDERLFIAMEYVEGENLKVLLQKHALSVREAVRLGAQIAEGLDAAHRAGVIHRDIKPENIMVMAGSRTEVKLMDFGIANVTDTNQGTHLTSQGMLVGTPAYMAPERIEAGQADERADIYAFGILLYEMLTGDVPFSGQTPAAMLIKHLQAVPPPLREIRTAIPAWLEALVLQTLEKDPNERPSGMREIAQALRQFESTLAESADFPPTIMGSGESPLPRKTDNLPSGRRTRETPSQEPRMLGGAALAITATFLLGTALTVWIITNPQASLLSAFTQLLPSFSQTSSAKNSSEDIGKTTNTSAQKSAQKNAQERADKEQPLSLAATQIEPVEPRVEILSARIQPEPPQPPSVAQQLAALSSSARQQEAAQKLTTPAGDNAWETYRKLLQLAPEYTDALAGQQRIKQQYIQWAQTAEQRQEWTKARDYYTKILVIAPQDTTMRTALDRIKNQEKVAQAKKSQAKEHLSVSKFHFKRGQYAEALAALEKARSLQPQNAEVMALLKRTQKAWDIEKRLGVDESF